MITYEIVENSVGSTNIKATLEDGTELWIPPDPANSDYQAYLAARSTPIDTEDE
jgi:hypothetical protein